MLPKTAEYALRAVVSLARYPGEAKSADYLAETTEVPRRYLHKVLQDLVRAKIVRSQSGPGGGYSLAKVPQAVTLLDVVNAASPLERIRHCPLAIATHTSLCPLHKELDKAYAANEAAFAQVTIAQLLRTTNRPPLCEAL